jgi:hypothetical protein
VSRFAVVFVVASCRMGTPTEIVVTVDTTFGVPCTIDTLHVEVVGGGDPIVEDVPITDADLPGSLTLVPDGVAGDVTVRVTGMRQGQAFAIAESTATFGANRADELRFVLDRACVPGPCEAVGVGHYVGLPPRADRRGCGQTQYAARDTMFEVRDACSVPQHVTVLRDKDELEQEAVMPFPFSIYGVPQGHLWIGTNGYIGFGETAPMALVSDIGQPRSLGEPTFATRAALPFWDDLRTGLEGVCMAVDGMAPDRIFYVTWKDACFASASSCGAPEQGDLTFTVALEETTDRMYVGYQHMSATLANADRAKGLTATIGITAGVPAGCADSACTLDGACASGAACGYTEVSSNKASPGLRAVELDPL